MNTFVVVSYVVSLLVFFVMSTLIIRHTVKYNYLSARFKQIVFVFGLIAVGLIVFSLFLIFNLYSPSSSSSGYTPSNNSSEINF